MMKMKIMASLHILKINQISEIMAERTDAARKKWKMAKFRPTMDFGKVI